MPMVAQKNPYTLFLFDDGDVDNPRDVDDCFGTMICFHNRYNLGDKHDYKNSDDFLPDLARKVVSDQEVIEYVKTGKSKGLKLEYNRSINEWEVNYYDDYFKKWYTHATYAPPLKGKEYLVADSLLDEMRANDLSILVDKNCCVMPLYLYDHGGITISTAPFSCSWDSGRVGYVYATYDDIKKEFDVVNDETKQKAYDLMKGEVDYYDHYLRGDCYGFVLYKGKEELDSCWGFIGDMSDLRQDIESYLPDDCKGLMNSLAYREDRYRNTTVDDVLAELDNEMEAC